MTFGAEPSLNVEVFPKSGVPGGTGSGLYFAAGADVLEFIIELKPAAAADVLGFIVEDRADVLEFIIELKPVAAADILVGFIVEDRADVLELYWNSLKPAAGELELIEDGADEIEPKLAAAAVGL